VKPIKVLFVGNYDIPVHNIRPEAEMIIGLKERGLDVEVMTGASCWYARRMASCGIRIHDYQPGRKFSPSAVLRLRRTLREGRHDILHLFNNKAIVAGVHAALGLPVRVVTYRGQTGNVSRFDPVAWLMHLSPRVDRIVCVSEAVRQSLLPELRDPGKAVTIYKGHDPRWYDDIVPLPRAGLGVPDGAFMATCIANNRPRKGVPVLIDAVGRLPAGENLHLVLVGQGMDGEEIGRLIGASPARDRIHVHGHRDDVLRIVAASDVAVLPAIKREGLPKTVLEAMGLGIAPLVTATGGSPELVRDGESGLVVPPGDAAALAGALLALSRDRERTRAMGRHARDRLASEFTLEASIAAHQQLYAGLAGRA